MQLQHWHYEVDANNIAWAFFDKKNASMNTLDNATLSELETIIEITENSANIIGLVITSRKKNCFIAGADIEQFQHCANPEEGLKLVLYGQAVFSRLEKMRQPTLALIDGICLGGGLELALACRYRIAIENDATQLGLPEIKLGIHPGWGGTIRLPRLIGSFQALPLILSGKSVNAFQAKSLGIVDFVLPVRDVQHAIISVLKKAQVPYVSESQVPQPTSESVSRERTSISSGFLPSMVRTSLDNTLGSRLRRCLVSWFCGVSNLGVVRILFSCFLRWQISKKTIMSHYPALNAAISQWQSHGVSENAYAYEAASLVSLFATETSQNLIRLFFLQTRLKNLARKNDGRPQKDEMLGESERGTGVYIQVNEDSERALNDADRFLYKSIRHVHIIGAGTMGGDIAAWCALNGFKVTLQDRDASFIAPAISRAASLFVKKLKLKHVIQAASDRLIADVAGEGVRHADVIIEAIYENLEAKQNVFKSIEQTAKPSAILATNTSSIPLDDINRVLQNPERLVGIHFFNPVAMMQLVEVVRGEKTSEDVFNQALAFVKRIKRLPLPVKSSPGFLVNRILMPYLLESVKMLEEGISMQRIDQAAIQFGMPMGPIELADTVGLDVCLSVAQELTKYYGGAIPQILQEKVAQKQLGKKTGKGFYVYPKKSSSPQLGSADTGISTRLINCIVHESEKCLQEGVVADADLLDAGMVFGTGFAPFRGGPMWYAKTLKNSG